MEKRQVSESIEVSMLLTFIGGFLEIYSFLLKGHVFATTVTGNIVLMLFNLYDKNFTILIKYIFPILGFSLGVVISIIAKKKMSKRRLHWRIYVILFEMLLITIIYLLRAKNFLLLDVCLISMVSAIQIQTFMKIKDKIYMSTMCTGNTRKFVWHLVNKDYEGAMIFALVIFSFGTGVITGGYLIHKFTEASILIMLIPLLVVLYLVHKN